MRGWLSVLVMIGCGGGGEVARDASPDRPDAIIDAPMPCDLLDQTTCPAGARCTWVNGTTALCEPDGSAAVDAPCTVTAGVDDCVRGAVCADGTCRTICDFDDGTPACDGGHTCANLAGIPTGICEAQCDPLQQTHEGRAACGATQPDDPDQGCFTLPPYDVFRCFAFGHEDLFRTDRQVPGGGNTPRVNGCAPGFVPLLLESSTEMTVLCTGLCAPLETDTARAANARGDAAALAKLPTELAPRVGDATCEPGKKGSEAQEDCRFLWSFLRDEQGNPGGSPYDDTLGVCFAFTHFQYDSDGDQMLDTVFPGCASLPPRSAATPGAYDDAADWGCWKHVNSTRAVSAARLGYGPAVLVRHAYR